MFTLEEISIAQWRSEMIISQDRKYDEDFLKSTADDIQLCISTPSSVQLDELKRVVTRRLETAGRYVGDQDHQHLQSISSWSSTRAGEFGRGWTGKPKWDHQLLSLFEANRNTLMAAKKHGILTTTAVQLRLMELKSAKQGSYGKYLHVSRKKAKSQIAGNKAMK
jgi:hypothetical protein